MPPQRRWLGILLMRVGFSKEWAEILVRDHAKHVSSMDAVVSGVTSYMKPRFDGTAYPCVKVGSVKWDVGRSLGWGAYRCV